MATGRLGLILFAASALLAGSPDETVAQKRQRNVITREEIQASAFKTGNLHAAIRSLRPQFLAPARGVRTLGNSIVEPLAVYLNGTRQNDVDALRTIQADAVDEVRFLTPTEAGNQFGPKASGGALLVKLRKASGAASPVRDTLAPPPAAD
ncbi:MAG: hypothetical protein M3365_00575 [Gemmatimonadota bacterium]|nr:hypothetical protein [Gemmatimonadota bacterium]